MTLEQTLELLGQAEGTGRIGVMVLAVAVVAAAILVSVAGLRGVIARWFPPRVAAWLTSERGGVALSLLSGQGAAMLTHTLAGQPISVSAVLGLLSSLVASGSYSWARKAAKPRRKPQLQR